MKKLFFYTIYALVSFASVASDLMEVQPVTNKILMIFLKDGHIDTYGVGQDPTKNIVYHSPTNLANASNLTNYTIISSEDSKYSTAKSPIAIGRKSKGLEYQNEWEPVKAIMGHWIYIELPTALEQGKKYKIQLTNIVENQADYTFLYDVNTLRSPALHVNMVGFPEIGPKYAYLSQWMGDFNSGIHQNGGLELEDKVGAKFRLIRYSDNQTVFTGTIAKRMDKTVQENNNGEYEVGGNYSNADVWECDFSTYTTKGEYIIAVDGIGCSYPFEINNESIKESFYFAMKGLFWQRQGIVKQMENGKIMPRDHHYDDVVWKYDANWQGGEDASKFITSSPQVKGIYGYYHDAGDWDHYEGHAYTPFSLLLLYDMFPDKFYDGEVDNRYKLKETDLNWIDESNNGIPDLLDEASWLVKFHKRAKDVIKTSMGGSGGVPGYMGRDGCNNNGEVAWTDPREWYVSKESVTSTYHYAALASWYAECLNKFHKLTKSGNHPEYASWISEATDAWDWASAKVDETDETKRAKGLAAICMFRSTGLSKYHTAFIDYYNLDNTRGWGEWSGTNTPDLARGIYLLIPSNTNGLDVVLQNTMKTEMQSLATSTKINTTNFNGFRNTMEDWQHFQLGPFNTLRSTTVGIAYKATNDKKYVDGLINGYSYVMGGNQLNMAYLSGLSEVSDIWVFNPNGYLVNDYNSKVYGTEPNIGYNTYFGSKSYWFTQSVFSEKVSRDVTYPIADIADWPESESKFYNRYSIQGGEFTHHQNNKHMIYSIGLLKAMTNASNAKQTLNAIPTLTLSLTDNQDFSANGCSLKVNASSDTRSVKYYYEWHFIGESKDKTNNFALFWDPIQNAGATMLITAVGYDDRGRHTLPTDLADKTIKLANVPCNVTTEIELQSLQSDFEVQLLPNPASNILHIITKSLNPNWMLYNSLGQFLGKGISQNISVNHLNSGVYLIEIDGKMIRFIKE